MASKLLTLDNPTDFSDNNGGFPFQKKKSSKLWLFMIGSSAAGIIKPLSRYFISGVSKDVIVPIFIDCNSNSATTSSAVEDIGSYETFCRLTCQKSKIAPPFLFIENSVDTLFSVERFRDIMGLISENDEIFIAFSAHSEFNVSVAIKIGNTYGLKNFTNNIKYGIFLPYFTFYSNEEIGSVVEEIKNQQTNEILNQNINFINTHSESSSKFFIGLSDKSIINKDDFKRNPFNIVQLIVASSIVEPICTNGLSWTYNIPLKEYFLTPGDLRQDEAFRNTLLTQDFLQLAYSFLDEKGFMPTELKKDLDLSKKISSYLETNSNLILSLGDITMHAKNRMLLRLDKNLNSNDLNNAFYNPNIFGRKRYSSMKFAKKLKQYMDTNMNYNSNIVAYEVIKSIRKFIKVHFEEIQALYH